jgi:hypothetical protein
MLTFVTIIIIVCVIFILLIFVVAARTLYNFAFLFLNSSSSSCPSMSSDFTANLKIILCTALVKGAIGIDGSNLHANNKRQTKNKLSISNKIHSKIEIERYS